MLSMWDVDSVGQLFWTSGPQMRYTRIPLKWPQSEVQRTARRAAEAAWPLLRRHQLAHLKSSVSLLSALSRTRNIITQTLPVLLLLSAPVKAGVQSFLSNFFLLSSCLQGWQTFSCRPWTQVGAYQLFSVKTYYLLLSVTIVGIRSE